MCNLCTVIDRRRETLSSAPVPCSSPLGWQGPRPLAAPLSNCQLAIFKASHSFGLAWHTQAATQLTATCQAHPFPALMCKLHLSTCRLSGTLKCASNIRLHGKCVRTSRNRKCVYCQTVCAQSQWNWFCVCAVKGWCVRSFVECLCQQLKSKWWKV